MAREVQNPGTKKIPRSKMKDDFGRDPRFLRRIENVRASLRVGCGIRLEDVDTE